MMKQREQITLQEIELLRRKLLQTVDDKGYSAQKTVEISQQLDQTLNYYNCLQQSKLHDKL